MLEKELNGFMSLDYDELFYINGGSLPANSGGSLGIPGDRKDPMGNPSNPTGFSGPSGVK